MTDELRDHVNCLIRHSVLQDIKGVPFTVVANQWAIQGAETADSFYRVSYQSAKVHFSNADTSPFSRHSIMPPRQLKLPRLL